MEQVISVFKRVLLQLLMGVANVQLDIGALKELLTIKRTHVQEDFIALMMHQTENQCLVLKEHIMMNYLANL